MVEEEAVVVDFTPVLLAVVVVVAAAIAVVVSKIAALFVLSESFAANRSFVGQPLSQASVEQHPKNGVSSWEHVYHSPVLAQACDLMSP